MKGIEFGLDKLFHEHRNTIIKMLIPMVGCYHTAEDLSQEAYLKVSGALNQYPIEFPRSFLYQTAKNLALDHLRKEKFRNQYVEREIDETQTSAVISPNLSPENSLQIDQQVKILHKILASQPQQRREMLVLNKVHGWKYDEIAKYMNLSRSAVEKNIRISIAQCLDEFSNEIE
jgi:RNA polymerase sigma factor (sigma-70 family)